MSGATTSGNAHHIEQMAELRASRHVLEAIEGPLSDHAAQVSEFVSSRRILEQISGRIMGAIYLLFVGDVALVVYVVLSFWRG